MPHPRTCTCVFASMSGGQNYGGARQTRSVHREHNRLANHDAAK